MDKETAIKWLQLKTGPWMNELDEVMSPIFTTEWGKRAALGGLIFSGVMLFYMVLSVFTDGYHNYTVMRLSQSTTAVSTDNVAERVAQIPKWHLFGEYGVAQKSAVLPITSLQIVLTGIVKGEPESVSRVFISEGGKPGKVYQVGDVLESGVKVYAITEDSVVLQNGGQLEKLPLRRVSSYSPPKYQPTKEPEMLSKRIGHISLPRPEQELDDEGP